MTRLERCLVALILAVALLALGLAISEWVPQSAATPAPARTTSPSPSKAAQAQPAPVALMPGALRIPETFEDTLLRESQRVFGLAAPIAALAAQLHQESGWRPDARSPYALGLAQFTPGTASDMARRYPNELSPAAPLDPRWAIRAQVHYMRDLRAQASKFAADGCEAYAFTLSGYNGGSGWWPRDRKLAKAAGADDTRWWANVERHTSRSAAARRENRDYPVRILRTLQPRYAAGGAPGARVCA